MNHLPKDPPAQPNDVHDGPPMPSPTPAILTSHALLRGQQSVVIEHNGALYRLQMTRQSKLILTK